MKIVFILALTSLLYSSLQAEEVGPPPAPSSVNGVFHLIVVQGSKTFESITFESLYPNPERKTLLFIGSIKGIGITGEIIGGPSDENPNL